ncbi:MAG: hypothetical protein ACE5JM_00260 [Armatimonadota bacterium]
MSTIAILTFAILQQAVNDSDPQHRFVRPGLDTDRPVWGLKEGIRFAVWPGNVADGLGPGGPRGLIRVGYPIMPDGECALVNFIAIEPIVRGQRRRGYSELEPSARDGKRGKLIDPEPPPTVDWDRPAEDAIYPGHIEELDGGAARLTVCLRVEKFRGGAHVYLLASVRTDRPDELALQVFPEDDSAPLAACILTATMGNLERLRQLHLADRVVTSHELYGDYEGDGFAPHRTFVLDQLPRAADGSVIVAATTDEEDPSATWPDPRRPRFWLYPGQKVTQYWRKYAGTFDESLRATVNARRVYWASKWPIPNGIAFENFELNEGFVPGQTVSFGLTPGAPDELLDR